MSPSTSGVTALEARVVERVEVVEADDLVAAAEERRRGVASDEARGAREQDLHGGARGYPSERSPVTRVEGEGDDPADRGPLGIAEIPAQDRRW